MTYHIRDALLADLPAIRDIYNDAVLNTTAIWNEQTVDLGNRQAWFSARQDQGYPVLVIVDGDNSVLGYASFGDWRPFDGFRHTVEHSVYVERDCRGRGIGRRLLETLIERAKSQDYHVLIGGIDADNAVSIELHKKFGFTFCGEIREAGFKFGRWLHLVFYQLILETPADPVDG